MKHLCIAALILILAGCASSHGMKIDNAQLSALTAGQTRIADAEAQFGPPTSVKITSEDGMTTTLTYDYTPPSKADAFPILESVTPDDNDKKQTVSLVFDSNGVLKSYKRTIEPLNPPAPSAK